MIRPHVQLEMDGWKSANRTDHNTPPAFSFLRLDGKGVERRLLFHRSISISIGATNQTDFPRGGLSGIQAPATHKELRLEELLQKRHLTLQIELPGFFGSDAFHPLLGGF